jgi:hypothetical protein
MEHQSMKAAVIALGISGLLGLASGRAQEKKDAQDLAKGIEVAVKDLEDYSVKNDLCLVNNLALKETVDDDNKSIGHVRFSAVVRNRTEKELKYRLMVVGFDSAKKPLWTYNSNNQQLGPKDQTTLEDTTDLPAGSAKATATIWVRAVQLP